LSRTPRSRLPPKLPEHGREREVPAASPRPPSLREQLKQQHVAGRSLRFGRDEIVGVMRQLVHGTPATRVGLPPFAELTIAHVERAMHDVYGWEGDGPRARIAPTRTIEGFTVACARMREVASSGGRLAFATTRPASLLPVYQRLVEHVDAAGATVLAARETAPVGPSARRVRWIQRVAVLSDGATLFGEDDLDAADEWLFTLARPDLVVADRTFAGVAGAGGIETIAFADLDSLALAVAAWQGRAIRIVPLDDRRPPDAYAGLLELLESLGSGPEDAPEAGEAARASGATLPTGT